MLIHITIYTVSMIWWITLPLPQLGFLGITFSLSVIGFDDGIGAFLCFIGDRTYVIFSLGGTPDNPGTNSRTYHAFQCEDYVGRISDLAVMCNKGKLEEAILPRYYMGFPNSTFKANIFLVPFQFI